MTIFGNSRNDAIFTGNCPSELAKSGTLSVPNILAWSNKSYNLAVFIKFAGRV